MKRQMVQVQALENFNHHGRPVLAGDVVSMTPQPAARKVQAGWAKDLTPLPPQDAEAPQGAQASQTAPDAPMALEAFQAWAEQDGQFKQAVRYAERFGAVARSPRARALVAAYSAMLVARQVAADKEAKAKAKREKKAEASEQ